MAFHLAPYAGHGMRSSGRVERGSRARAPEPARARLRRFPWAEAIVQFLAGLGAAHSRDSDGARGVRAAGDARSQGARQSGEALFAQNIRILGLELDAWRAHVAGYADSALALMRGAAELEDSTPKHAVTPAPTLPADEAAGDLLLEVHRPAEALVADQRSIALYPNRFNGLLGAARAARAVARPSAARGVLQTAAQRRSLRVAQYGSARGESLHGHVRPSGPPRLRASCTPGSASDS